MKIDPKFPAPQLKTDRAFASLKTDRAVASVEQPVVGRRCPDGFDPAPAPISAVPGSPNVVTVGPDGTVRCGGSGAPVDPTSGGVLHKLPRRKHLPYGLTRKDEATASRLADGLRGQADRKLAQKSPMTNLNPSKGGGMCSPDGDPLIRTDLGNGRIAWVDPKTDQYYLSQTKRQPLYEVDPVHPLAGGAVGMVEDGQDFGDLDRTLGVSAHGPFKLPAGLRFDGDDYSRGAVDELTRIANPPVLQVFPHTPIGNIE